jgi:hypothetical protein
MMMMMKNQNVDNCFCYSIIQFVNIKHYVLVDLRSHTVYIHTTHDLSRRGSRHISNISLESLIIISPQQSTLYIGLSNFSPSRLIFGYSHPAPASCLAQIVTPPGLKASYTTFTETRSPLQNSFTPAVVSSTADMASPRPFQHANRVCYVGDFNSDFKRSVVGWVTKIYYLELLRAFEGTLSCWSRLHLQLLASTPVSRRVDVRKAGRKNKMPNLYHNMMKTCCTDPT